MSHIVVSLYKTQNVSSWSFCFVDSVLMFCFYFLSLFFLFVVFLNRIIRFCISVLSIYSSQPTPYKTTTFSKQQNTLAKALDQLIAFSVTYLYNIINYSYLLILQTENKKSTLNKISHNPFTARLTISANNKPKD
jgi:hypothetical protein